MSIDYGARLEAWERRRAAELSVRNRQIAALVTLDDEEMRGRMGGGGGGSGSSRPKRSKSIRPRVFLKPKPQSMRVERDQISRMEGLVSGSQPAVVKMASFGGGARLGAMLNYVSRNGDLRLENHLGRSITSKEEFSEIRDSWQSLMTNRTETRDIAGFSVEISGLVDAAKTDDFIVEVLKVALGDRHFVYSVSPKRDGGLKVEGVSVLRDSKGERLTADAKANNVVSGRLEPFAAQNSVDLRFRFHGFGNGVEYGSYKVRELVAATGGEVKNENGKVISTYEEAGDLVQKTWRSDLHSRKSRDVMHVIMSARAGTDIDAFRETVRDFLSDQFGGHKYVFAVHDEASDTKDASLGGKRPHVHAHAIITMKSEAGERIVTNPQTFRQWRDVMAEHARNNGIKMEMSDRRELASAPAYSANHVRPVYSKDRGERASHVPTSASAEQRYQNKRDNVNQMALSARSRQYALKAAMNWQLVAARQEDQRIAVNASQFGTKIINAILDVQTDASGQVISFNSNHSAMNGVQAVQILAQEADHMPEMNRQQFDAYEKVSEEAIAKVVQIIPENQRKEFDEVIALARQSIELNKELMEYREWQVEREKSFNSITREVGSEFAKIFAEDIAKDAAENITASNSNHAAELSGNEEEQKREPYPTEVMKHYFIRNEKSGQQSRVFADHKGERELFLDSGERMRSKTFQPNAVRIMVETAAHRGWTSIDVSGSTEFKREAWIEAQAHGITAKGYKPTELDWQEVERREERYLTNEIVRSDREQASFNQSDKKHEINDAPINDKVEKDSVAPINNAKKVDYSEGVEGRLIENGEKPYLNDPENKSSPYVVIEVDGTQHTAWGVGIPSALEKEGIQVGDTINLREDGFDQVEIPYIETINGVKVQSTKEVERRVWKVDLIERADVKVKQDQEKPHEQVQNVSKNNQERAIQQQNAAIQAAETVRTDPPHEHVNRDVDFSFDRSSDMEHDR